MNLSWSLQADPWTHAVFDIESLNANVTDRLRERIEAVRARASHAPETTSVAVLGSAGAGKTHLFARLRRQCGAHASFVLIRPLLGAEPTLKLVLAEVVDQLHRPSYGSQMAQLDVIVGGLLSQTTAESVEGKLGVGGAGGGALEGRGPNVALDELRGLDVPTRNARLDAVVAGIVAEHPDLQPTSGYLTRLFRATFEERPRRAQLATWLSGRDLDAGSLDALGLAGPLSELDALRALKALAVIAAHGAPLVIAFDQLENLADARGDRVRAHGNLVCELVDQVPALTIVQLGLTGEWLEHIEPSLTLPQRTRVAAHTYVLASPNAEQREALLREWISTLGEEKRGPFPAPLTEAQLRAWKDEPGMTPRMLMLAFREATAARAEGPDPGPRAPVTGTEAAAPVGGLVPPVSPQVRGAPARPVLNAWNLHVEQARVTVSEAAAAKRPVDADRLGDGVACVLDLLPNAEIEWTRGRGKSPVLVVRRRRREVTIVVIQGVHPRAVSAAFDRATAVSATGKRVLLVRQGSFTLPETWADANAKLAALRADARIVEVPIGDEEAARMLALASLRMATRSQEISDGRGHPMNEEVVQSWAIQQLGCHSWELCQRVTAALSVRRNGKATDPLEAVDAGAPTSRSDGESGEDRTSPPSVGEQDRPPAEDERRSPRRSPDWRLTPAGRFTTHLARLPTTWLREVTSRIRAALEP